jgi:hypothetical protein
VLLALSAAVGGGAGGNRRTEDGKNRNGTAEHGEGECNSENGFFIGLPV